jgi:hypothetical protein
MLPVSLTFPLSYGGTLGNLDAFALKMPNESEGAALTLAQGDDDATLELLPASCAKFHELGSILAQILASFSALAL